MARRYAAVTSFGSGSSFVWTSVTNDELTAENKPALKLLQSSALRYQNVGKPHENERRVEILLVFLHVVGVVLDRFSLVDRVKVRSGFVAFQRRHEQPQGILYAALDEPHRNTNPFKFGPYH